MAWAMGWPQFRRYAKDAEITQRAQRERAGQRQSGTCIHTSAYGRLMRAILKWSIPIVLVGAAVWLVLSIRITMPINEIVQIQTPAGPIDFRLVVLPSGPVRISMPPHWQFDDIRMPGNEIDRIFSDWHRDRQITIQFLGGADLTLQQEEAGGSTGYWTAPATANVAPYLRATSSSTRGGVRVDHAPAPDRDGGNAGPGAGFVGRWRIHTATSSAVLDLYATRDGSGLFGTVSALTGSIELGGHADSDGLRLTFFDGERAVAVRGKLEDDGTISGEWWDSQRGTVSWRGARDE